VTPAARVQAAIECLDAIIAGARDSGAAADTLIQRYFSTRRYAGSKDRRAVRELVYAVIRAVGEPPASGRAALLGWAQHASPEVLAAFGSGGHGPEAVRPDEPIAALAPLPVWLAGQFEAAFGAEAGAEAAALLERAPLDLRVNTLKATRDDVLARLPGAVPTRLSPLGLRLDDGGQIDRDPAYLEGLIEIQDEGSQLVAAALAARPGETVLDLCAGAGGKTLALAAAMGGKGRLVATDTDRGRQRAMMPRLERAGVDFVEARLLDPGREAAALADLAGAADAVLVDAPCSGTGTWRRNPEARWRLTPERLDRLTGMQARLLEIAASLVRPGGRLVYAVCSVLPEEGAEQAAGFSVLHPDWRPLPLDLPGADGATALLTPLRHGCDGFFIAGWQRP
jgi:16S rRNA (cytosine967-C5)-methyltransferase